MKNSKYWAERFEVLETAMNRYGQDAYRKIEPAFDRALREIDQSVEKWLNRIAVNNQISLADARKLLDAGQLEEFKWTVEEYIKYGQENALNQQWMKQLENASAKFHISKLEAMRVETQNALEKAFGNYIDEVDDMAKKVLENGYYRSIFEVQKGTGVGWDIASINEEKLKRIISKPWATDGENFSSRIWKNKVEMVSQLHNELTRNCILGKAPDEAIKDMTQYVKKSVKNAKNAAGRLVMTEEAYFSAEAQREAFKELGVGEYEIIATLDSRTSEVCQDMDGRVLPMSQYEPGVTAPPFHPWCRTTTAPYFDDLGEFERAARDKNGKTYHVPGDMKYSEWKKSLVGSESDSSKGFGWLENHLKESYNILIDSSVKDLDYEEVNKGIKGVEYVLNDYPDVGKYIEKITTDNSGVMSCNGERITFNPSFYKDKGTLEKKCEELSKTGFWVKNTTPESIGVHEAAHGVEWALINANPAYEFEFQKVLAWNDCTEAASIVSEACKNIKKTEYGKGKTNKDMISAISKYATASKSETMAEAFADVYANGDNASPLSKEIKRLAFEKMKKYKGE